MRERGHQINPSQRTLALLLLSILHLIDSSVTLPSCSCKLGLSTWVALLFIDIDWRGAKKVLLWWKQSFSIGQSCQRYSNADIKLWQHLKQSETIEVRCWNKHCTVLLQCEKVEFTFVKSILPIFQQFWFHIVERRQKIISSFWYTKNNLFVSYWVLRAKHGFICIWDKDKNPTFSVKQILNIISIQVVKKGFN